jgi:hypothetical protein
MGSPRAPLSHAWRRDKRLRARHCEARARAMASSLQPQLNAGVISRMTADQNADLFWDRGHWPR